MGDGLTPTEQGDVIEVREEECIDVPALEAYLRGRLPGAEGPLRLQQFGGGHANLTYLLRFGESEPLVEYVLRRPPLGPVAPGAHDMKREYRALSVLWKSFPLAPRAHLLCDDPSVLGADFFVMERLPGVVVRKEIPPEFGSGRDPKLNRRISEVVIDALARFHEVDPLRAGLGELGRPDGFLERQVRGWTARYERARTSDFPLAEELAGWLHDNLPKSPPATLLHNDWKLDNMALDPSDPGRCVAVYDWDMCTRGDPLCDLGTLMASWIDRGEGGIGPAPMPTQAEGFMQRSEAVSRYADRTGQPLDAMPYYLVFGAFKMAVVVQQIFYRFHQGQTRDARFAGMEMAAHGLFEVAAAKRP